MPSNNLLNLLPVFLVLGLQLDSQVVRSLEYTITPSSQVAYYHYPSPRGSTVGRQNAAQHAVAVPHPHPQQHPQLQQAQQRNYQVQQQHPRPHHPTVVRQFMAPSLERAAFTQALSSQGYVFGAASAPITSRAIGAPSAVDANSLNVRLPVPFGITPLNVAQLPLQAGAPYSSLPRTTGLTSYGTPQIQRRR